MKNVTLTIPEDLAQRARVEAAKEGKSLSKFIAETLAARRSPGMQSHAETLQRFLNGPGWPGVSKNLPEQDELYDRPALFRHQHPDLRNGSGRRGKAKG